MSSLDSVFLEISVERCCQAEGVETCEFRCGGNFVFVLLCTGKTLNKRITVGLGFSGPCLLRLKSLTAFREFVSHIDCANVA